MGNFSILFLSIGRRVELVNSFKETAKKMGIQLKLVGVDSDLSAPALYFCDSRHKVPKIKSHKYLDILIGICLKENIDLIIPTIDTELGLLSKNKDQIERKSKSKLLLSSFELVRTFQNKKKSADFFIKNEIKTPKTYDVRSKDIKFPVIIKPSEGSSSVGVHKILEHSDLILRYKQLKSPIIQEYIDGDEYTVDAYFDSSSTLITAVPRLRISTRAGEISKGKIIKNKAIIQEVINISKIAKFTGPITFQFLQKQDDYYLIEINPRFGGGYPMSYLSGANFPEYILKELMGETLGYNQNYENNIIFSRYDQTLKIPDMELE